MGEMSKKIACYPGVYKIPQLLGNHKKCRNLNLILVYRVTCASDEGLQEQS